MHGYATAPDGASTVIELMRVALGNAGAGYDQLVKNSEQAAQAVVASFDGSASRFAPPPAKTGRRPHTH